MLTPGQLLTEAQAIVDAGYATVKQCDRHAFALALFFQGYSAGQACHKAFVELEDTDGALQMLARHRASLAAVAAANDEGVARIIDPGAWQDHAEFSRKTVAEADGIRACQWLDAAEMAVKPSLTKAAAIRLLSQGEGKA